MLMRMGSSWTCLVAVSVVFAVAGCSSGRGRVVTTETKVEILDKVVFATDTADLLPVSHETLDAIARTLTGSPDIRALEIQGHLAECGPEAQELSSKRANVALDYLRGKGVKTKIRAVGYGCTMPIFQEPAKQHLNERVEFEVLERADS